MTPPIRYPRIPLLRCPLAIVPTMTWGNHAGYRVEHEQAAYIYNLARLISWPRARERKLASWKFQSPDRDEVW